MMRLSKLMAERGLCSRREADRLIESGQVLVDGAKVDQLGSKVEPEVSIQIVGKQAEKITFILNKPLGYACSPTKEGHPQAIDLLDQHRETEKLAIAGRLDINSRGLLLFTTDGALARKIIQPDSSIEKEYIVRIQGEVTTQKLDLLRHGLSLDGSALKPAKVQQTNSNSLIFVLREGKKRQIRRMCEAVDIRVTYLKRVRIGAIQLGSLKEGKYKRIKSSLLFTSVR